MATVTGVRFKKAGKVYYFDPDQIWPQPGDPVVVETSRGIEIGETITGAREVSDDQIVAPLKKVLRIANEADIKQAEYAAEMELKASDVCQVKITEHKLEMKLVDVEYTFDNTKIIFYFTANGRVDFRDLVKDLAAVFKMRIELRQIGVRDEAKMLGGLGACGRPICCGAFLSDFQPVSIKMAKEQNLSLNPTKISGQCGRLMCCLKYEQDFYESTLKRVPRIGKEVMTPDGWGIVSDISVLRERIKVRVKLPDDSFDMREYEIDAIQRTTQTFPAHHENAKQDSNPEKNGKPTPANAAPDDKQADKDQKTPPEKPESQQRRRPHRPKDKKSTDAYFNKAEPAQANGLASPETLKVDESDDTL